MGDLLDFFQALLRYWWALMSCALFTFLGAYVLLTKKSGRWALWATFGAALLMLMVASFLAWREERGKVIAKASEIKVLQGRLDETTIPKLACEISRAFQDLKKKDYVRVTIAAIVINKGAPSVAFLGPLVLRTVGGREFFGKELPPNYEDTPLPGLPGHQNMIAPRDERLIEKVLNHPIEKGGAATGWVMYAFPESARGEMRKGSVFYLKVKDLNGTETQSANFKI